MFPQERVLKLVQATELCSILLNGALNKEDEAAACLALEYRLRIKQETIPPTLLHRVKMYINKGVSLRKQIKEDAEYASAMEEYENNVNTLADVRQAAQTMVDATTNTTEKSINKNLGYKEYQPPVPERMRRFLLSENKTSRVKHIPEVLPDIRRTKAPSPHRSRSPVHSHEPVIEVNTDNQPSTSGIPRAGEKRKRDQDEVSDFRRINVLDEVEEYFDKFNYINRKVKIKILPLPNDNEDIVNYVHAAIDEVCSYVKRGCLAGDLVALSITNDQSPERPIYINARLSKTLDSEVVLNAFQKVCQSNNDFIDGNSLTFELHQIEMSVGHGPNKRYKLYGLEMNSWVTKKRGLISVHNVGSDCLAAALVLGKAMIDHNNTFNRTLQRNQKSKRMLSMIDKIKKEANVDLSHGGGRAELQQFQDYLKGYKIIVFNNRDGTSVYFAGEVNESLPKIYLYLENNHYTVIKNLTAAFGYRSFCEKCYTGTIGIKHSCEKSCTRCKHAPKCEPTNVKITCEVCNRKFLGPDCYSKHLIPFNDLNEISCELYSQCKICDTAYKNIKDRQHVCNEYFCKNCNDYVEYGHLCYIKQKPEPKHFEKMMDNVRMIFLDFETIQDTKKSGKINTFVHEVNLCVTQTVCKQCMNINDPDYQCIRCGPRTRTFYGVDDVVLELLNYLVEPTEEFEKTVCLAHNGSGFDWQFVLRKILTSGQRFTQPKLIMSGTRIMSMKTNNLTFLDSMNFLPMPLSKLPASFDLKELQKGYFPYLFNTVENQTYVGPIPATIYFQPDSMSVESREKFMKWYNNEVSKNEVYNFREQLISYCKSDVNILREGCLKFRNLMLEEGNIECFLETTTIASSCNLVYRRNFLKEKEVGLVPSGGYRWRDNQSTEAVEWLVWKESELGVKIQHAGRGIEAKLLGRKVDGYYKNKNGEDVVLQYHGCWTHACKKCFSVDDETELPDNQHDTMALRRERTDATRRKFQNAGIKYVEMWGCDFKREKAENPKIQHVINSSHMCKKNLVLNIRDSLKGGRTNAIQLYYKAKEGEKIRYMDFTSLYPFINKYRPYPEGHPKVYVGDDCPSLDKIDGFAYATVLAPTNLFYPVLPYTMHGKLMFFLCKKCAEISCQNSCTHTDEERMFTSTFVTCELKKAVACGYKIIKMHECWHYKMSEYNTSTKTGGILAGYISKFSRLKVEASGYPIYCDTPEKKQKYIDDYFKHEGIQLDSKNIVYNAGKRSLCKLLLNSIWGKFGERNNLKQFCIISSSAEMYSMISKPGIVISSFKIIDQDRLMLLYEYEKDLAPEHTHVSVPVASFTTAFARLHLYQYLETLGTRCLYFDTDSFIFVTLDGVDVDLPSGIFLGELTNEIECYHKDAFINEFVSGGPKNYGYKVKIPDQENLITVHKTKGITLNSGNKNQINFEKLKDLVVCGGEPIYIKNPAKILRTCDHQVLTTEQSKMYRVVYSKRRIINNTYKTLPFGYVDYK